MATRTKNAKEIFVEAIEQYAPSQWPEFLNEACGNDTSLRSRVEMLLKAHIGDESLLDKPAIAPAPTIEQLSERLGTAIGPYKLLEQIGEGGMGLVYMAEQQRPVRRLVALKIIKPGMDSKQVIARFEAERQALALMDHPNIARVLDAGTTDAGRPYFIMELVRGIQINQLCDEKRLTVRQRLELFIQVCQAVQHAHQKGIIHRDLKPTNVLVTMHDSEAVPKVIDFGIAKALGAQLTEHTLHTGYSQLVGTPLYMSPEQAEMNQFGVDTRSDVYSLGVMLYELLTGSTPFDKETLTKAGFDEMRRIIREHEPERPSARLSTLQAQALSTVSERRSTDPRRITTVLRGELDWIVMKSLEKDRTHRYESPSALAADIQRYLSGDLVQACPPSPAYRFRKFARKHKAALTTGGVIAATLFLATAISLGQATEANRARKVADERLILANDRLTAEQQARREAEQARRDAEAQRDRADRERQRAERERQRAESERLRAESERLRVESERQRADRNLESALEASDRLLAQLGSWDLDGVPDLPEGIRRRLMQSALEIYERLLADSDNAPEVRHALARVQTRFGAGGDVASRQKVLDAAVATMEELSTAAPKNTKYQESLALACFKAGDYYGGSNVAKAIELKRRAASLFGKLADLGGQPTQFPVRGQSFRDWQLYALCHLVGRLNGSGNTAEAATTMQVAGKVADAMDDPLSGAKATYMVVRANRLKKSAPEEADALYRQSVDIFRQRLATGIDIPGWNQGAFAGQLMAFAAHLAPRDAAQAETLLDEALVIQREAMSRYPNFVKRKAFLVAAVRQVPLLMAGPPGAVPDAARTQARREKALALLTEAIQFGRALVAESPNDTEYKSLFTTLLQLQNDHIGWPLFHQGKLNEAEPYIREYVEWMEKARPSWTTFDSMCALGYCMGRSAGELRATDPAAAAAKSIEAEKLLLRGYQELKSREQDIPEQWKHRVTECLKRLTEFYTEVNKPDEAAKWRKELESRTSAKEK